MRHEDRDNMGSGRVVVIPSRGFRIEYKLELKCMYRYSFTQLREQQGRV